MGEGDEDVGEDDGVVGVDRRHTMIARSCSSATGREGERAPSSFFFFLGLPPRWEEGSPSGPWLPWWRRGRSPSEIGSPSLFSSVSRSQILALHRFLNIRRSVTPIAPILSPKFSPGNYLSCARRRAERGPGAVRGSAPHVLRERPRQFARCRRTAVRTDLTRRAGFG
jgi:hypothetical protein